jgi:hypothetical protein
MLSYFYLHKWPDGLPIKPAGLEDFLFFFLGVFAELRKATISFVMSVHPPAWNNTVPTRRIFMKFDF